MNGSTSTLNVAAANGRGIHGESEVVRRDARWADLERLRASHPMMDAVIDEVNGRKIRVGDHWLCDFASCNYLGFDLHPEIIESVERELWRWGTHPSWSRLLGNPRLYVEIEEQLTALLGAPDSLVLPTITLIHYFGDPGTCRSGNGAGRRSGPQDYLRRGAQSLGGRARPSIASEQTTTTTSRRSCVRCPLADHAYSASTE